MAKVEDLRPLHIRVALTGEIIPSQYNFCPRNVHDGGLLVLNDQKLGHSLVTSENAGATINRLERFEYEEVGVVGHDAEVYGSQQPFNTD